jgi:hypothetical protein
MPHPSDSAAQQQAHAFLLEKVADLIGKPLEPATVALAEGASVRVDGATADGSVFVELNVHHGSLKGGQRHKVATDAFKLITIGRDHPEAELILAFADPDAAAFATEGTWMSVALEAWSIKVLVIQLDADVRRGILAAQRRQVMVNPDPRLASSRPSQPE